MLRQLAKTPEERAQLDQIRDALGRNTPWLPIYDLWIYTLYLRPKLADGTKNPAKLNT